MHCPACQSPVGDDDKFCGACGEVIVPETEAPVQPATGPSKAAPEKPGTGGPGASAEGDAQPGLGKPQASQRTDPPFRRLTLEFNAKPFYLGGIASSLEFRLHNPGKVSQLRLFTHCAIAPFLCKQQSLFGSRSFLEEDLVFNPPRDFQAVNMALQVGLSFTDGDEPKALVGRIKLTILPPDSSGQQLTSINFGDINVSEAAEVQLSDLVRNLAEKQRTAADMMREMQNLPEQWAGIDLHPVSPEELAQVFQSPGRRPGGESPDRTITRSAAAIRVLPTRATLKRNQSARRLHLLSMPERVTLGRKSDCDLVTRVLSKEGEPVTKLFNGRISRLHTHFQFAQGELSLVDGSPPSTPFASDARPSGGGTYLDGNAIGREVLKPGFRGMLILGGDSERPEQPVYQIEVIGAETVPSTGRDLPDPTLQPAPHYPVALLARRQDNIPEDFLLVFQPVNLRRIGLTDTDCWVLPERSPAARIPAAQPLPADGDPAEGSGWSVLTYGRLDFIDVLNPPPGLS
ncbi:MAG: hypothetical protein ACFE0O_05420 [Opitutales bacterium]